jgi:glycosyltransferase involved in cell wall biosynthesis
MEKKISIIIPIYNVEKYLRATLDNVRFQTYTNLEIICVLDCPTDNSAEIVRKLAAEDARIKIVEHTQNSGPAAARNNGVQHASGEYLHFMDSDDLLSPNFYEMLIHSAEKNNVDVAVSSFFYEKKPKQSIIFLKNEVVESGEKITKTNILFGGQSWRYLIKKSFWDTRNFSFPNLMIMEDQPVMIQVLFYANKVALCADAIYFYKNRENSILNQSAERKKQQKEDFRKGEKLYFDFLHAHNIKRPSWLYRKYISQRTKHTVCVNAQVEYGKYNAKISVIIPIFNAEKYIEQTLNSIRFQTYKNVEILCVLDCPTDNSEQIISEIARNDERIKIIRHTENKGPAEARNTGVKNASGEYLHFMDSDDVLSPDFYETMINAAIENNAEVAASSVYYEKKSWKSIWFTLSEILTETNNKIAKTEVTVRGWAWRYIIKKSFWQEYNLSFPNLLIMEDTPVMIAMIFYAKKVVLCPGATYFYLRRESSILNRKNDTEKEQKLREHRHLSRKMCKDFLKEKNIKRPCKLWYDIRKYIH